MSENSKLKEKSVIAMSAAKKQSDTSEVQNARVTRYKRAPNVIKLRK